MRKYLKILGLVSFLMLVGLGVGCNILGFLASESYNEQKIPAEFMLSERSEDKVLIFVEKSMTLANESDLEDELVDAIGIMLVSRARVKDENLILHGVDWEMSSVQEDFSQLSIAQIGAGGGAELVLYVRIDDYKLYEVGDLGYYDGSIVTRSGLYHVSSGKRLWPQGQQERLVRAGFKFETRGRDEGHDRLISAVSHCITRNFYDCLRRKYKSSDEQEYIGDF